MVMCMEIYTVIWMAAGADDLEHCVGGLNGMREGIVYWEDRSRWLI